MLTYLKGDFVVVCFVLMVKDLKGEMGEGALRRARQEGVTWDFERVPEKSGCRVRPWVWEADFRLVVIAECPASLGQREGTAVLHQLHTQGTGVSTQTHLSFN